MNWTREPLPDAPNRSSLAYFYEHALGKYVVFITDGEELGRPVLVVEEPAMPWPGMFYGIEDGSHVEEFVLNNGLDYSKPHHWRILD